MNTDKIFAEAIANEYAPKNASKVLALKRLDRKARLKANIFAYTFGTLMALVLGVGMCMTMIWNMLVPGILIGIVGIVLLLCLIPLIKGLK